MHQFDEQGLAAVAEYEWASRHTIAAATGWDEVLVSRWIASASKRRLITRRPLGHDAWEWALSD